MNQSEKPRIIGEKKYSVFYSYRKNIVAIKKYVSFFNGYIAFFIVRNDYILYKRKNNEETNTYLFFI